MEVDHHLRLDHCSDCHEQLDQRHWERGRHVKQKLWREKDCDHYLWTEIDRQRERDFSLRAARAVEKRKAQRAVVLEVGEIAFQFYHSESS